MFSERRTFAIVGKCICIWLLIRYPEIIITRWDTLAVLLAILVATEVAKTMIERRTGVLVSESSKTESTITSRVTNPDKR